MQEHVDSCSRCQAECEGLKNTLSVCQSARCETPSDPCRDRVDAAIKEALGRV